MCEKFVPIDELAPKTGDDIEDIAGEYHICLLYTSDAADDSLV